MQHGHVEVPLELIDAADAQPYTARDLLTGTTYVWTGAWNYVRLDPAVAPAHILSVTA